MTLAVQTGMTDHHHVPADDRLPQHKQIPLGTSFIHSCTSTAQNVNERNTRTAQNVNERNTRTAQFENQYQTTEEFAKQINEGNSQLAIANACDEPFAPIAKPCATTLAQHATPSEASRTQLTLPCAASREHQAKTHRPQCPFEHGAPATSALRM